MTSLEKNAKDAAENFMTFDFDSAHANSVPFMEKLEEAYIEMGQMGIASIINSRIKMLMADNSMTEDLKVLQSQELEKELVA